MNIVLDSNVIIAAFLSRGLCTSIFELSIDKYTVVISEFILFEIFKTLHKKYKLPKDYVDTIINYLRETCIIKTYEKLTSNICRDKDDDEILALAIDNDVKYIISGDKDLLVLKKYKMIKIFTPREFWENIRKDEGYKK